jgi:AbrB family looped-hinge helix DNA binding protein
MNATLSEKGQITIPKELRDRLGLKTGTVLEFESREGKLVAWKKVEGDPFEKWRGRGKLPAGKNATEYLQLIRHGHRD